MLKVVGKKLVSLLVIFLAVTFFTFCLISFAPSDPAEIKLSKTGIAVTGEVLEQTREEMGLNKPMPVQYLHWLAGVVRGDLGTSYRTNKPVMEELGRALPLTVKLAAVSMLFVVIISIPVGVLCAKYKDRVFDKLTGFLTYIFIALPSFVMSLLMMYVLCVRLNWFKVTPEEGLKGYLMPAVVMALSLSAWYIRQVRTIVLNEWSKEYVTGAWARGVHERLILFTHILKNAMIPILTLMGNTFAMLLGGTTIVENIFSIPGAGYLVIESISNRDYPVIQAYVVWMAVIFLIVNGLIDLSYSWIDPRVRRNREAGNE